MFNVNPKYPCKPQATLAVYRVKMLKPGSVRPNGKPDYKWFTSHSRAVALAHAKHAIARGMEVETDCQFIGGYGMGAFNL